MIMHFDMTSGELIEEDQAEVEASPRDRRDPQTALRLMTVDEAITPGNDHARGLTPDVAAMPVASWLAKWR